MADLVELEAILCNRADAIEDLLQIKAGLLLHNLTLFNALLVLLNFDLIAAVMLPTRNSAFVADINNIGFDGSTHSVSVSAAIQAGLSFVSALSAGHELIALLTERALITMSWDFLPAELVPDGLRGRRGGERETDDDGHDKERQSRPDGGFRFHKEVSDSRWLRLFLA